MNWYLLWLHSKQLAAATVDQIGQILGVGSASVEKRAEKQPVPQPIPVEASVGARRKR